MSQDFEKADQVVKALGEDVVVWLLGNESKEYYQKKQCFLQALTESVLEGPAYYNPGLKTMLAVQDLIESTVDDNIRKGAEKLRQGIIKVFPKRKDAKDVITQLVGLAVSGETKDSETAAITIRSLFSNREEPKNSFMAGVVLGALINLKPGQKYNNDYIVDALHVALFNGANPGPKLLSGILPPFDPEAVKAREQKIGEIIYHVASRVCQADLFIMKSEGLIKRLSVGAQYDLVESLFRRTGEFEKPRPPAMSYGVGEQNTKTPAIV